MQTFLLNLYWSDICTINRTWTCRCIKYYRCCSKNIHVPCHLPIVLGLFLYGSRDIVILSLGRRLQQYRGWSDLVIAKLLHIQVISRDTFQLKPVSGENKVNKHFKVEYEKISSIKNVWNLVYKKKLNWIKKKLLQIVRWEIVRCRPSLKKSILHHWS